MATQEEITAAVEETLRSFDSDTPLAENPHLATRILAERRERLRQRHGWGTPALVRRYALLGIIVVINLVTLVHYEVSHGTRSLHEKLVADLKAEFQMNQSRESF